MTWTYTSSSGVSTDRDKIRLLIGDVSSSAAKTFNDEELTFFGDEGGNVYGGAAIACEAFAAYYADQVSKSVGSLRIDLSNRHDHFIKQANEFQTRAASGSVGTPQLYAGGLSISDKDTVEADTDRVQPDFYRGQDDFPNTIIATSAV